MRWKVFQGMAVAGQNEDSRTSWESGSDLFDHFVATNSRGRIKPLVERESVMRGSYAMLSPDGRFFDSMKGFHSYSDSVLAVGVERAWKQICFDSTLYGERTRNYSAKEEIHAA